LIAQSKGAPHGTYRLPGRDAVRAAPRCTPQEHTRSRRRSESGGAGRAVRAAPRGAAPCPSARAAEATAAGAAPSSPAPRAARAPRGGTCSCDRFCCNTRNTQVAVEIRASRDTKLSTTGLMPALNICKKMRRVDIKVSRALSDSKKLTNIGRAIGFDGEEVGYYICFSRRQ
jgi:hypothetical protein